MHSVGSSALAGSKGAPGDSFAMVDAGVSANSKLGRRDAGGAVS